MIYTHQRERKSSMRENYPQILEPRGGE